MISTVTLTALTVMLFQLKNGATLRRNLLTEGYSLGKRPQLLTALLLAILALPILSYAALIGYIVADIPCWDDFDSILNTMLRTEAANSQFDKLKMLFSFHNEHRLGILRVTTFLLLKLTGAVNFSSLIILGNLGLIIVFLSLGALYFERNNTTRDDSLHRLYALPTLACASLLIFQPQFYDTPLWPTVLLSNITVVYFSAFSFLLLATTSTIRTSAAFLLGSLALFSQGNGVVTLPIGLLILISNRNFKIVIPWSIGTVALTSLYFIGFQKPAESLEISFERLVQMVDHGLSFLGAGPAFTNHRMAIVIGLIETATFLALTIRALKKDRPSIYFFLLFLFLTVGLNCLGRNTFGPEYVLLQPRYKFLSDLTLGTLIVAVARELRGSYAKFFSIGALFSSFCLNVLFYAVNLDNVLEVRDTLLRGAAKWVVKREGLYFPVLEVVVSTIDNSKAAGIYDLGLKQAAPLICEVSQYDISNEDVASKTDLYHLDLSLSGNGFKYLEGWASVNGNPSLWQNVSIILEGDSVSYLCKARSIIRPDVRNALQSPWTLRTGFAALVPEDKIQRGKYEILFKIEHGSMKASAFTGQSVEFGAN